MCLFIYILSILSIGINTCSTTDSFHKDVGADLIFGQEKYLSVKDVGGISRENSPPCKTTDGSDGFCTDISSCNYNDLEKTTSLTQQICSIDSDIVGICCPTKLIRTESDEDNEILRVKRATTVPQAKGCGLNGKSLTRILEAEKAEAKDWPWMAVLLRKENYDNFCGGALLNRRYVLTAAHCLKRKTVKDFYVRLGEYDFGKPNETDFVDFEVSEIIRHPQYDENTEQNDIALLKLDRSCSYNSFVRPICLPTADEATVNSTAIVAGWGSTFFGSIVSDVLMEVPVPIWDRAVCTEKYMQTIFDTNICASGYEGGKDSCSGDSGGPLMLQATDGRWNTIGVVSWGIGCGGVDSPGVYTKVFSYLSWIGKNIGDSAV